MSCNPFLIASLAAVLTFPLAGAAGTIRGAGAMRCQQYLEHRHDPCVQKQVVEWVLGYFSHYEQVHPLNVVERLDTERLDEWLAPLCEKNPTANLIGAVLIIQREFESEIKPDDPAPVRNNQVRHERVWRISTPLPVCLQACG